MGVGETRSGRSLRGRSESLQDISEMVVGEFWEEFTPNKASQFRSFFRCDGDLCVGTDKVLRRYICCTKTLRMISVSYTEPMCYDCCAFEEGSPTPEGFFCKLEKVRVSGCTYHFGTRAFVILTRGSFFHGNLCGRWEG